MSSSSPRPHLWALRIVFRTEKVHIRDLFRPTEFVQIPSKMTEIRSVSRNWMQKIGWWFLRYPISQTRSRAKPESRSFPRHCPHLSKVTLCIFKNQGRFGWHLGVAFGDDIWVLSSSQVMASASAKNGQQIQYQISKMAKWLFHPPAAPPCQILYYGPSKSHGWRKICNNLSCRKRRESTKGCQTPVIPRKK